jgi:hypothetical protein
MLWSDLNPRGVNPSKEKDSQGNFQGYYNANLGHYGSDKKQDGDLIKLRLTSKTDDGERR